MKNVLVKDFFAQIKNSFSRFLSILLIVSLGAGFFVGVKAAGPSMKHSADKFFNENNLMDFRIVSDFGFQDDDINPLKNLTGVKDVMPSYSADLLVRSGERNNVVKVHALPKSYDSNSKSINQVKLVKGRLPKQQGECVVESNQKTPGSYKIGDTVKFTSPNEDSKITDIIKNDTYKVVGLVETPLYISFDRGVSTVGDGSILYYMMILPEEFNYKRYTEVYMRVNNDGKDLSSFDKQYKKIIELFKNKISKIGNVRLQVNHDDIMAQAGNQIEKAKKELEDKKSDAEKKLKDAEEQIKRAEDEISAKEKELADGEKKLEESQNLLNSKKAELYKAEQQLIKAEKEYNEKIASAEKQLAQGKAEYQAGLEQYNKQNSEFQKKKAQAETEIAAAKSVLQQLGQLISALDELYSFLSSVNSVSDSVIDQVVQVIKASIPLTDEQNKEFDNIVKQIKNAANNNAGYQSALTELSKEISSLKAQYKNAQDKVAAGEKQLADGERQLAEAKKKLDSSKAQLDNAEKQLNYEKVNGRQQLNYAQKQINDGKKQLESGQKECDDSRRKIEEGKKQLAEGKDKLLKSKEEYNKNKDKADAEFALAEQTIKDKEKQLNELANGKWYVFTREDNPGYSSFMQDADRIDGIAAVFPLFFFIVAALVCLTTMTRMVEEKRTEIGTLKALGYDNKTIIAKYFFYAFIAAVLGSILGIVLGMAFLPKAIFKAYDAMYTLPEFYVQFSWITVVISIIGSLLCTCTVAAVIAGRELKENAATLMRPKSPKIGKRIFLEKIPFIWNKMSFSVKVTARNIFRYKARFIMTVLGVAGCTALILAAYGLKDSISVLVPKQYGEIFNYDVIMACKYDVTKSEKTSLVNLINQDDRFKGEMLTKISSMQVKDKSNTKNIDVKLFVPETSEQLPDYIKLKTRRDGKSISFNDNSVVITEKLASLLSLKPGDTICLKDDSSELKLKVTDIAENYVFNYVYISPSLYKAVTGNEVKFNSLVAKLDKNINKEQLADDWLKKEEILVVNFNSDAIDNFNDVIKSLDSVVLVMIICAAALAFIVVYNLTNINVVERMREIATIKVLGFSDAESANYVYRENIILSAIGIILGLVVGIFLSSYIVTTVEMDIVMFGRKISGFSFLYAASFTFVFTLLVNAVMYKKINGISMVESLKSVE